MKNKNNPGQYGHCRVEEDVLSISIAFGKFLIIYNKEFINFALVTKKSKWHISKVTYKCFVSTDKLDLLPTARS